MHIICIRDHIVNILRICQFFKFRYTSVIMSIAGILPYIQIILSVLLIGGVLLQQSEAGMGGAFGGGDGFSSGTHSKRGAEKIIFIGTIVVSILFAAASFIIFFI